MCIKRAGTWVDNNIFDFKKLDGGAYLALYVLFPVAITAIGLSNFPSDSIASIYFYVTVFVSALNCIYDAANRWVEKQKTFKNSKLFLVILSATIVAAYCTVVIIDMLIGKSNLRRDVWLLSYIPAVIVTLFDIVSCFVADMALWNCTDLPKLEGSTK